MTTAPILRGRAASAIRPGIICKRVLLGELPLDTGEMVSEAAITDLFNAYKRQLREYNQTHEKKKQIKGMNYHSFCTMFKFAQLLHLVTFVRNEEADWKRKNPITTASSLLRVERSPETGRIGRVVSNKRVFALSDIGREDVKSWLNLTRAWKEQWPAPQVVEIPVIIEKIVEKEPITVRKEKKPKVEEVVVPVFKLKIKPSKEQYIQLLDHLVDLQRIGIDNTKVQREIDKLANQVGEWVAETIEDYEDAQSFGRASRVIELRNLRTKLTALDESLLDRDITTAIEQIRGLAT